MLQLAVDPFKEAVTVCMLNPAPVVSWRRNKAQCEAATFSPEGKLMKRRNPSHPPPANSLILHFNGNLKHTLL